MKAKNLILDLATTAAAACFMPAAAAVVCGVVVPHFLTRVTAAQKDSHPDSSGRCYSPHRRRSHGGPHALPAPAPTLALGCNQKNTNTR